MISFLRLDSHKGEEVRQIFLNNDTELAFVSFNTSIQKSVTFLCIGSKFHANHTNVNIVFNKKVLLKAYNLSTIMWHT